MKHEVKKLLILNLPYLLFVYLFDKIGAAVRLAPGTDASEKLLQLGTGFAAAFSSIAPSLHPIDLLIGIAGAVIIRLAVYMKGKNAKKYRKGIRAEAVLTLITKSPGFTRLTSAKSTLSEPLSNTSVCAPSRSIRWDVSLKITTGTPFFPALRRVRSTTGQPSASIKIVMCLFSFPHRTVLWFDNCTMFPLCFSTRRRHSFSAHRKKRGRLFRSPPPGKTSRVLLQ